jgi:DNA-binding GntR family transcriptional regulator
VSRTTARKAVGALRDAGLVESVRGWGSFVSNKEPPKAVH